MPDNNSCIDPVNQIDAITPAIKNKTNWKLYLVKIDRLAAWILLFVAITYGITGYGMTKGIIDPSFARILHFGWLGSIGLIAFVVHTYWAVHLALKRNCLWDNFSKICLTAFYIILVIFFLWVQFFYQVPTSNYLPIETPVINPSVTSTTPIISNTPTPSTPAETAVPVQTNAPVAPVVPVVPESPASPVFTATSIKAYNGQNGRPAYIAVDGLVYDVSSLFRGGIHKGWTAGQDLSSAFHDQHSSRYLQGFAVVGTYKN